MSRIGMRPVVIPQGVKLTVESTVFHVEGPKGRLSQEYRPDVTIAVKDGTAVVERKNDSKQARAYHGLYRSLLNNMVTGVSQGFKRVLVVSGVGYRAEVQGNLLVLNIGYSTDVVAVIPEGLKVSVEQNGQRIVIEGIDYAKVANLPVKCGLSAYPSPTRVRVSAMKKRRSAGKSARPA